MIDNFWEYLYVAEEEGNIPTRRGKMNKVIKLILENPEDVSSYIDKFEEAGLDISTMTKSEMEYITKEINRRL